MQQRSLKILSEELNHGGTRNRATEKATGDYFIFMAQDPIQVGEYFLNFIRKLLKKLV
jgi:hypothetical protein